MTITFPSDNDVIVYALEKIISYARANQYIIVAQCIWWIVTIIGLQQGLIIHIDNLKEHVTIGLQGTTEIRLRPQETALHPRDRTCYIHPDRLVRFSGSIALSDTPSDLMKDQQTDQVQGHARHHTVRVAGTQESRVTTKAIHRKIS
jgi:hypothetical protein